VATIGIGGKGKRKRFERIGRHEARQERGRKREGDTYETTICDPFPISIHEFKETGFVRFHGRVKNSFQATE
jgi:hypothetical protein